MVTWQMYIGCGVRLPENVRVCYCDDVEGDEIMTMANVDGFVVW